jgi:hypothetical protein
MRNAFVLLLALSVALAACAPRAETPTAPDLPTNSDTPQSPRAPDYSPQPGDVNFTRDAAYINSFELLTMESSPLQFSLALKGALPTQCNKLRVQIAEPDAEKAIAVDVYSVIDPAATCTQALEPFEITVPLGSFPAGHYKIVLNGGQAAEFDA